MKHVKLFEQFLNEAKGTTINGAGPKVKKFISIWDDEFGDITDINLFSDVDKKIGGGLDQEWHDALKNMNLKPEEAICVFYDSGQTPEGDEIIYTAEEAGISYEEVVPKQMKRVRQTLTVPVLGGPGILFALKQ